MHKKNSKKEIAEFTLEFPLLPMHNYYDGVLIRPLYSNGRLNDQSDVFSILLKISDKCIC